MIIKTEAIVLKSFDYRETSRIATFFTEDYGKVSGVLKGIRSNPKKFGSSVEKFSVNDIVYYQYRNSDLHLVSQCDLKQYYFKIRNDYKKMMAASYISELINKVMPSEEKNKKVYQLMINFFSLLETPFDVTQLVHIFQIKMLLFSGFRPHLDACLKCKCKIDDKARFSHKEGGLVCFKCKLYDADAHIIAKGTISSILYIEKNSWENCLKLRLTPAVRQELKYLLNNFLVFHFGRRLKSAKYLK